LASSPEPANPISQNESQSSARDRSDLDHGRDIAFDIGKGDIVKIIEMQQLLEIFLVESSRD
jgi:hypothetical protein